MGDLNSSLGMYRTPIGSAFNTLQSKAKPDNTKTKKVTAKDIQLSQKKDSPKAEGTLDRGMKVFYGLEKPNPVKWMPATGLRGRATPIKEPLPKDQLKRISAKQKKKSTTFNSLYNKGTL